MPDTELVIAKREDAEQLLERCVDAACVADALESLPGTSLMFDPLDTAFETLAKVVLDRANAELSEPELLVEGGEEGPWVSELGPHWSEMLTLLAHKSLDDVATRWQREHLAVCESFERSQWKSSAFRAQLLDFLHGLQNATERARRDGASLIVVTEL